MPDRVERIEVDAATLDAVLAVIGGRRYAVLTLDGRDTAVISTPDGAYDAGFALAIEPLTNGLDRAIDELLASDGQ